MIRGIPWGGSSTRTAKNCNAAELGNSVGEKKNWKEGEK